MTYRYNMCRRPLYRSRSGMIFGVCQGLAKYSEIPVLWVRLVMCALFLLFFPAAAFYYLLAAVLMKPEPVMPPATPEDWDFYNSWASDRSLAIARIKKKFEKLERRTRRMEDLVTAREFDWDQRLNSDS